MMVTPIGIGAWSWGDRSGYWGYGEGYQKEDNEEAFRGMVESGIGLIDTAEVSEGWPRAARDETWSYVHSGTYARFVRH